MTGIPNDPVAVAMSAAAMDEALTRLARDFWDAIGDDDGTADAAGAAGVLNEAARRLRVYEDALGSVKEALNYVEETVGHEHDLDDR